MSVISFSFLLSFRIIELSSDYILMQEKNEKEHLILCEQYRLFMSKNHQRFDSTEVIFFQTQGNSFNIIIFFSSDFFVLQLCMECECWDQNF